MTKSHICAREREREREDTLTNLFKISIFHRWLRGKIMSNLYVKPWYPVGMILEFDRPMDMTAIYGGTWELFGAGRMTVGIDAGDADFNTAGETGGSKEMQKHKHDGATKEGKTYTSVMRIVAGTPDIGAAPNHLPGIPGKASGYQDIGFGNGFPGSLHNHIFETNETGTGNAGNMSPYIVVYRYRKVAY